MEANVLHYVGIMGVLLIYYFYREYRDNKELEDIVVETSEEKKSNNEIIMEEKRKIREPEYNTKDLVYITLRSIGCVPEEDENGRILFEYQGITFLMDAVDDCMFVNLIWPWCHSFSSFDVDELARARKVINEINAQGTMSVFYSFSDSDEVAVHIKKHFLFVPQIPDLENYFKLIINAFFRTVRVLELKVEQLRMQESEK